jgi:malonyl-CoA O-methyltransferase
MSTKPFRMLSTSDGYDLWSTIYDDEDNPLVALESREIARFMTDLGGLSIADIGCGTGRHTLAMAAAGAQVTAVDFSKGMLAKARAKPGGETITFVHCDLEKPLHLESSTFNRATCCLVLDHITHLDRLLAEMARICRSGGDVLISVMHPAMMLQGIQAQFTDPNTGATVRPASAPNQISDYVMAAARAGLIINHMSEHAVDEQLAERSPRARKYLGWPLLLLMRLLRP